MGRRIAILIILALFVILFVGLLITWLMKNRSLADRESARESLRQLGQFAATYQDAIAANKPMPEIVVVPPGTLGPLEFEPERRMSWVPPMLPLLNQQRQNMAPVLQLIDPSQPWDSGTNAEASRIPIRILLAPANPPTILPDQPAPTQFVGLAGLGAEAATLPIDSPRAGSFRYDTPTPLAAFADGLSNTLLFGETNHALGPWLQGGFSTVRGVTEEPKLIGEGGQFGGIHPGGANFGMADGSVRYFRDDVQPMVFRALCTRNGGQAESEQIAD